MNSFTAMAARIISVLSGRFVALACLAVLSVGTAQAQTAFKVKIGLEYKGGLYTVRSTSLSSGDRVELPVDPKGVLRVYARAIPIPGINGQALVDLQVYESRGGVQVQITSLTMPVYLATENTADVDSKQGKLKISAFVEDSGAAAAAPMVEAPGLQPIQGPSPSSTQPAPLPTVTPSQALPPPPYVKKAPGGPISIPEGAVPVPVPVPAPGAAPRQPVSGGFSPLPRTKTATLGGGSCHDLAMPQDG